MRQLFVMAAAFACFAASGTKGSFDPHDVSIHFGVMTLDGTYEYKDMDTEWQTDNKDIADYFLTAPENSRPICLRNDFVIRSVNYPESWGAMRFTVDGEAQDCGVPCGGYDSYIRFPADGTSHTIRFEWPDMGENAYKEYSFTDMMYSIGHVYHLRFTKNGSGDINSIECSFKREEDETTDISRTFSPMTGDQWSGASLEQAYRIVRFDYPVDKVYFYDGVEEGQEHQAFRAMECDMVPVTADLLQSGKPQVSAGIPAGSAYPVVDARIYTVNSLCAMFYSTDSPEGKNVVESGVTLNGKALDKMVSKNDPGLVYWSIPVSQGDNEPMVFSIEGHRPVLVDDIKFSGRSITIDGEERTLYDTDCHYIILETGELKDSPVQLLYVEMDNSTGSQPEQWQRYPSCPEVIDFNSKEDLSKLRLAVLLPSVPDPEGCRFIIKNKNDASRKAEAILQSSQPYMGGSICRLEVTLSSGLATAGTPSEAILDVEGVGEMHLCHLSDTAGTLEQLKNVKLDYSTSNASLADADTSGMGKLAGAMKNFKLGTPTAWPISLVVRHDENGFFFKGIMRYNLLNNMGMKQMLNFTDEIDKHLGYFEDTFHDICESVTHETEQHRYTPDERLTSGFKPTALIQGWIEGRFVDGSDNFAPAFSGAGLSFTAGAEYTYRVPLMIAEYAVSIGGSGSFGGNVKNVFLQNGQTDNIWGVDADLGLWINASGTLGLNLFVAKAVAGLRGGAELNLKTRVEKHSVNNETKGGLNLTGYAWLEGFAEARFLWWTKKWSETLIDTPRLNILYPNDSSNPFFKPSSPKTVARPVADRAEISYVSRLRPYRRMASPRKLKGKYTTLVDNVDAFASGHWIFGTDDMYYTSFDNSQFNNTHLKFLSGGTLFGSSMYGVKSLHEISIAPSPSGDFAVASAARMNGVPMKYLDIDPYDPANAETITGICNKSTVSFAVNEGKSWWTIDMDDMIGEKAVAAPRSCIDHNYKKADLPQTYPPTYPVQAYGALKIGTSVNVPREDDPAAQALDGDLKVFAIYLNTFDKEYMARPIGSLGFSHDGIDIADYCIGSNRGRVAVAAACTDTDKDGALPTLGFSLMDPYGTSAANSRLEIYQDINLTRPSILAAKGKGFYIAGLDGNDISIYYADCSNIWDTHVDGARPRVRKVCGLGLDNRGVTDFRVIQHPDPGAESVDGCGIIWKELSCRTTESTDAKVKASLYGARINVDESGLVYISTPMPLLEHEAGIDDTTTIMDFDGTFDSDGIAVLATVADSETGSAEIVRIDATLEDGIKLLHSGLNNCAAAAEDPVLFFEVMNQGVDPISQLKINVNGKTTVRNVNILPAKSMTVTAVGPWNITDPSKFVYKITPTFVADLSDTAAKGTSRKARALRAPASSDGISGELSLHVSDISVDALQWLTADNGDITVPVVVYNMTEIPISPELTVKVGIYTDPSGQNLAGPSAVTEISAADLYDKAGQRNLTRVLKVTATAKGHRLLYVVARSVDREGNVVHDVHPGDNCKPLRLEPSGTVTSVDIPTESSDATFTVSHDGPDFTVEGLHAGDTLRVYEYGGTAVKWIEIKEDGPVHLTLYPGCFIFTDGETSEKTIY